MAGGEDNESKTEEPTDQRIKTALEKGDIPHSREVAILAPMAAALIGLFVLAQSPISDLAKFLELCIGNSGEIDLERTVGALVREALWQSACVVIPFVLILMFFGVMGSVGQNQPRLVGEKIKPQFSRLSLSAGFKRIFGLRGLGDFAKSLIKLGIVSVVGYNFLLKDAYYFYTMLQTRPDQILSVLYSLCFNLMLAVVITSAFLSAADFVWVRFHWRRNLKMTRQEVKDEHKQAEGDPLIKGRIKALARERARRRMLARVPTATVVIANPTHFAVALRYVRSEGGAPLVVAKGKDLIALKIREVAEKHGIPVLEDKPLARSLYDSVDVDKMIPPEFYRAVAKVILFISSRKASG